MKIFSVFGELLLKDSATNAIDSATNKAKGLDLSFGNIIGTLAKIGAAIGVTMGFQQLFSAAEQGQKTMAQMGAVLKSTGDASGETQNALVNLANAQSKVTTYSKSANEATENLLLTFTNIGQKTFPQALTAVNDMSTALGQDTKSSAIQLGKALNDPVKGITALSRVGVSFTQQQKDQIAAMEKAGNVAGAQGVILQELQKEFGGSAEAAGKTFAGQLTILQNQLTSVGVGIVSKLMPPLTELVTNINNNMPKIQTVITNVLNFIESGITTLTPIVKGIITDVIQIAQDVFPKMGSSGSSLGSTLLGLAKGGLTTLKDVLDWLAQHGEATRIVVANLALAFASWKIISTVATTINGVKSAITNVGTAINTAKSGFETFRIVAMYAGDGITSAGSAMLSFGKSVGTALISLGKMTIELGANALAWIAEKTQLVASTIAEGAATVAQTALNLAMSLNPITIIIIAIAGLVAAIVVLYNKNQWFRDGVNTVFSFVKSFIMGAINDIIGFFKGLVNGVESAGNSIKNGFNAVVSWFESLPSRFFSFGSNMINSLRNGIGSVIGTIAGVVQSGFNGAISFITSLPSKAIGWGKDFISGLINGIKSMVGSVGEAVSGIASKITSFLHFSVPDEGSLTDYETWMPDFVDGMTKGLTSSSPKLINAVKGLSTDVSGAMKPSANLTGIASQANSNNNSKMLDIMYDLLQAVKDGHDIAIDGKSVAKATAKNMTQEIAQLNKNYKLAGGN